MFRMWRKDALGWNTYVTASSANTAVSAARDQVERREAVGALTRDLSAEDELAQPVTPHRIRRPEAGGGRAGGLVGLGVPPSREGSPSGGVARRRGLPTMQGAPVRG